MWNFDRHCRSNYDDYTMFIIADITNLFSAVLVFAMFVIDKDARLTFMKQNAVESLDLDQEM